MLFVLFSSFNRTHKYKTKEKQTTRIELFSLFMMLFPLLLFVECFLQYVYLWQPILISNDDPKYVCDHDLISIWLFEPKIIRRNFFKILNSIPKIYLRWMNTNMNSIAIGFFTCNSFDMNDEFLSVDLCHFT